MVLILTIKIVFLCIFSMNISITTPRDWNQDQNQNGTGTGTNHRDQKWSGPGQVIGHHPAWTSAHHGAGAWPAWECLETWSSVTSLTTQDLLRKNNFQISSSPLVVWSSHPQVWGTLKLWQDLWIPWTGNGHHKLGANPWALASCNSVLRIDFEESHFRRSALRLTTSAPEMEKAYKIAHARLRAWRKFAHKICAKSAQNHAKFAKMAKLHKKMQKP